MALVTVFMITASKFTITKIFSPVGGGPKMSMAQSCQAPEGDKVLVIGSGLLNLLFTWHPWQVLQSRSASLSIPGHQTFMRNILFVFTIPWWPSCASSNTRLRNSLGMMMRVPRSSKLPWLHSSCRSARAYARGGLRLTPPLVLDILRKLYYLRKGD